MRDHIQKLLTFGLLFIGGNLLAAVSMGLAGIIYGLAPAVLMESLQSGETLPGQLLRASVWIQTVSVFIIPSIVFGWLYYRDAMLAYFQLRRFPGAITLLIAGIFLIAGYPFVQLSYEINSLIPLGESAAGMEDAARKILEQVLDMDTFGALALSLLIVAILPALGEELVFRGVLQRQLASLFRNEAAGIWIAAAMFSAIHFQFEGFLPRMVLGALMGYLYAWTRNLWVPIFVHFINNGFQVVVLYATGTDLSAVDETSGSLNYWFLAPGAVVIYLSYRYLRYKERSAHGS